MVAQDSFLHRPEMIGGRVALSLAAAAATASLSALIGYAIDRPLLVVMFGQQAMSICTAGLCLALAGAIWADVRRRVTALRWTAAGVLAISLGLLLSSIVLGHDALSPMLLDYLGSTNWPQPPETSAATASCCALLAIGCLRRPRSQPATMLASIVMLISGLVALGHAYNGRDIYALPPFRTFSFRTALSIFSLGTALIFSSPTDGIADLILTPGVTGRATRRQLSFLIIPPILAFVLLRAVSANQLGPAAAMAMLVVLTVAPLAVLILRDARAATAVKEAHQTNTQAETARQTLERRFRSLFNRLEIGFCIIEMAFDAQGQARDYRFIEANPAFEGQTGIVNGVGRWMCEIAPEHEKRWFDTYGRVARTGEAVRFEHAAVALERYYDVYAFQVDAPEDHHVAILFSDISARRQAELNLQHLNETLERRVAERAAELEATQEALRQSQKMEAIGQLTGGIAHDFNNLLTAISGSLELLSIRIAQRRTDEADRYIAVAQGAATRAAALTHRLLAFSRRQLLEPRPTDVTHLIADMADLIRRTVGPQITLEVVDIAGLWPALVDPNQLENTLLNLCINARDAMPDGGRITIETGNHWMDDHAARQRDLPPGQYLSLSVCDTGTGMSSDVIARAFDPFFTTKPLGQGTGLGLSMIYGFAQQSGGQAWIRSEIGKGTIVCVYLPRHHGEANRMETISAKPAAAKYGAGETVLVIDDEAAVRMLVSSVLGDLGYAAIEAENGEAGLKVLQSDARIDLLITDIGLPGMNGRQVADTARALRPNLTVLFITGYAECAAVGNDNLPPGMHVMTKPFAMETLASRINDLLADTKLQAGR